MSSLDSPTACAKNAMPRRVTGDPAAVLDDSSRALIDRIGEFTAAVMTMHRSAYGVAIVEVVGTRGPDLVAVDLTADRGALHAGQRLPGLESELGVEGQGTAVVGGLQQADAGGLSLGGAEQHVLHQRPPDLPVLEASVSR